MKKNQNRRPSIPKGKQGKGQGKSIVSGNILFLFLILLISFVAYLPSLRNGFVNWDDQAYILENEMLRSFNLKEIFSSYMIGNYHPITMLTYAIEFHLFGLNATGYHVVNLVFHLANTILVFYCIFFLTDKIEIALIVTLLFGIHPIHVESVAWASELKDLLYTFFFLSSYALYIRYIKNTNRMLLFLSVILFLFSLLSKAMAASLPAVFILTDYFMGRKINMKTLTEKIPFIVLALILGVVAVFAQQSLNAIDTTIYSFPQRIVFACYGFVTYLIKLIFPAQLCAFYPYPLNIGSSIPPIFFIYVIAFIAVAACVFYSFRISKKIVFGMGFFAITVFLVLQLLPVGGAIMADRYSYIPSIGIFYLIAEGLYWIWQRKKAYSKPLVISILILSTSFFSIKTYAMCAIWKDGMALWNDVIRQYQTIGIAYYNRGNLLMNDNKNELALADFSKTIELRPEYARAYGNRATVLMNMKKYEDALKDYNKTIELESDNYRAYNNRANLFKDQKRYEEALLDYSKAIELKTGFVEGYMNRAGLLMEMKRVEEAVKDYDKVVELNPNSVDSYNNRGFMFKSSGKYQEALNDFNKAIELDRNYYRAYYNRANLFLVQDKRQDALNDFNKVCELNPNFGEAFFNKGIIEYNLNKKENACADFQQAAKLGFQQGANAFRDLCH